MEKLVHSPENTPTPPDGFFEIDDSHVETATPFEYKILKGHMQPDGKTWKSDEKLRMDYLRLTDGLIQTMTRNVEVTDPETGEVELRPPSVVVFLDKSARPLSHLARELWPTFAKDLETGETPPMPSVKFLNIDREQWVHKIDSEASGIMDARHLDNSVIRSLRSVYLLPEDKARVQKEGLTEAVDSAPTTLDDEVVLLVDETRSTGRTLQIARGVMERAFPSATIKSTHWMNESFVNKGRNLNSVPVWYQADSKWGRGVNDRYADFSNAEDLDRSLPENYYRIMGRWFLSAPHWFAYPNREQTHDKGYYQLIDEFKHLAKDPDVPVIPAMSRYTSDEAYNDRIITYNYDVDIASLSSDEKEAMVQDVIDRKKAIDEDAAKHNRG